MNGKIKFFNTFKEFGFVTGEDGKDYFVHVSGLVGTTSMDKDQKVTFEVEKGDKGLKAVKVTKVA